MLDLLRNGEELTSRGCSDDRFLWRDCRGRLWRGGGVAGQKASSKVTANLILFSNLISAVHLQSTPFGK